jgi:hypothetical protein
MPLRWPQMAWHLYTKFHDDRFRHSSNIKGITLTFWEPIVLVLPMRGIYDVRRWNGLRRHDICTKFHDDRFGHLSSITVFTATIWESVVLVLSRVCGDYIRRVLDWQLDLLDHTQLQCIHFMTHNNWVYSLPLKTLDPTLQPLLKPTLMASLAITH